MGFYSEIILPRLCDLAMRNKLLHPIRERVIGAAEGRVLEIGVGSGLNLPFYRPPVREVLALEPTARLVTMARGASRGEHHAGQFPRGFRRSHPARRSLRRYRRHHLDHVLDSACRDGACGDPARVAAGRQAAVRRARPGAGRGRARWQDLLTPAWRCIGGGCHLNRPIRTMIGDAGFRVDRIETGYIPGPGR